MRPLTDTLPKPLLSVAGRPLIAHLIQRLVYEGYVDIIINHAYLGALIERTLGDGQKFGARIRYSREQLGIFDTGGGIRNALPLLGDAPFPVVNGDIWTDYPFSRLPKSPHGLAHLVLVVNPPYNTKGDFGLISSPVVGGLSARHGQGLDSLSFPPVPPPPNGRVSNREGERLTFSGLGVYRPELFFDWKPGNFSLTQVLRRAVERGQVTGERYTGDWRDIGTPERLQELAKRFQGGARE
uniref:Nucleotidyl transferase n=1 Tax=Candidatus Kentrum sp. SD TaxID=2126332 RepID=A0A450Y4J5_9GAMM|nr:MAG: Nucleotidyl transferase [Candidatus Kentron sp. SD]VFK38597.1 MAG: Nucleotidyl transferase [Candidatus Kentron sp. SD]VFK78624.1 MAG: Nucleotidyl transferase [Candidatus Kentron sp. SD]